MVIVTQNASALRTNHPNYLLTSAANFIAKRSPTMKFVSFNINGLRARPHQLAAIIEQHQPDVIGLQETKVHDDMFPLEDVSKHGYHVYYHGQKGHYGVALLSREVPLAIRRGFATDELDAQRRIIMADFATPQGILTVVNGYFPQGE